MTKLIFGISLKYFANGLFRIITQPTAPPWFWRAATSFSEDKEMLNHRTGKSKPWENQENTFTNIFHSQLSVTEVAPRQPAFQGHSKAQSTTQPNFFLFWEVLSGKPVHFLCCLGRRHPSTSASPPTTGSLQIPAGLLTSLHTHLLRRPCTAAGWRLHLRHTSH